MTNPVEMAHFSQLQGFGVFPTGQFRIHTHTYIYIHIQAIDILKYKDASIGIGLQYMYIHISTYIYIYTCMPILFGTVYLMMDIYVLLCVTKERYGYISIYLNLFGGFPSFSEA